MKPGPGIAFTLLTVLVTVHARDVLQPATESTKQKPWFCHNLDCPLYDLLNKTEAYEVRKYQSGTQHSFEMFPT